MENLIETKGILRQRKFSDLNRLPLDEASVSILNILSLCFVRWWLIGKRIIVFHEDIASNQTTDTNKA